MLTVGVGRAPGRADAAEAAIEASVVVRAVRCAFAPGVERILATAEEHEAEHSDEGPEA